MLDFNRRQVLKGGLAAGLLTAGGASLAGCRTDNNSTTASGEDNDAVLLPNHVRYDGVEPDFRGENGVDDAVLAYPADPIAAVGQPDGDGQPVTAMAMTNTPIPPPVDKNQYWQELNSRLGYDLRMQLVPSSEFSAKFQTSLAGEALPDLVALFTHQIRSLPQVLASRAVDLTPHLSGDAIQKYPMLANIPTDSWRLSVFGGKIFGVPVPRGAQSSWTLYGRRDMLEAEGITEPPATLADYEALWQQLTSKENDLFGLGRIPKDWLRQSYGIANGWSLEDGKLVSALEDERQADVLEAGRRILKSGVVRPDSFAAAAATRKGWMAVDSIWFVDDTFSGWPDFYLYPVSDTYRLLTWAPPALDGGEAPIWAASPTYSITMVNAQAADRIDTMLSLLNYLAAPFGTEEYLFKMFGTEGVHHELDGTDPVLTDSGKVETRLSLQYLAQGPWTIYMAGMPEVTRDAFEAQSKLVPTAVDNPTLGLYSETNIKDGPKIGLGDLENDILQGRKPVSAWAEGVADWKKKGGDKIRDEFQAELDRRNDT